MYMGQIKRLIKVCQMTHTIALNRGGCGGAWKGNFYSFLILDRDLIHGV